ncbi:HTH domain-containing protein [Rhodococcoides kyotonense]|uniref:HTH domain-containing protein n=1 Tax=Rhodococcoides kyotonense TaxID=398843 RepID=UPI000B2A61B9|nr:HTH domain-containing protein [Rhodococcus kyotonensis]
MQAEIRPAAGRRRRVTPETITAAGIELTLPKVTVKTLAEKLGVSIVAIYNNIDGIDAVKDLVAEEILRRWDFPAPADGESLHDALMRLAIDLRRLVHGHPGIAHYLVNIGAGSHHALAKIDAVQQRYATQYDLSPTQAVWAVATVAEHAIALAELVHTPDRRQNQPAMVARDDLSVIPLGVDAESRSLDSDFEWSMRAAVVGAVAVIGDPRFDER